MQDTPPSSPSSSSSSSSAASAAFSASPASDTASQDARPGRRGPCIDLVHGLSPRAVSEHLERARTTHDIGRRYLAFYLNEMHERRFAGALGFRSTRHYAEARLHLAPQRTSELIRVGAALEKLAALDEAFLHGEITWSAVELVSRVATSVDEPEWVEAARKLSIRQLKDRVQRRVDGKRPRREERPGMCHRKVRLSTEVSAVVYEMLDRCLAKMAAESGREKTESELIEQLLRMFLSMEPDGTVPGWKRVDRSIFQLVVTAQADPAAEGPEDSVPRMQIDTPDGVVELTGAAAGALACEAAKEQAIPRATRRQVLQRDGSRCRCCRERFDVHVHHLVFREHGGSNAAANLLVLCRSCHTALHDGLLQISGADESQAVFLDKHGVPLERRGLPREEPLLKILDAVGAGRPAGGAAAGEDGAFVPQKLKPGLNRVGYDWWAKHEHMLDKRLRVKPGFEGML